MCGVILFPAENTGIFHMPEITDDSPVFRVKGHLPAEEWLPS